jgi:hypothetical protein
MLQFFVKFSDIKFHQNPSKSYEVIPCVIMGGWMGWMNFTAAFQSFYTLKCMLQGHLADQGMFEGGKINMEWKYHTYSVNSLSMFLLQTFTLMMG